MPNHLIMMRFCILFLCFAVNLAAKEPVFTKLVLSDKFYAEGSHYGDFNKDGKIDAVAGPFWYENPGGTDAYDVQHWTKHEIYPAVAFDKHSYSENFSAFGVDVNGDGWDDYFVCPLPGKDSFWYENPKGNGSWKRHPGPKNLGGEAPYLVPNFINGQTALLYNRDNFLGFDTFRAAAEPEFTFHPVSGSDKRFFKYTPTVAYGDINGDGRTDIAEMEGWWEQPAQSGTTWKFHPFRFGPEPTMLPKLYDVDGDGLLDVVCSYHCHHYGLVWYKQLRDYQNNVVWQLHEILPLKPDLNSSALRFSQIHAFDSADFNGDGVLDFVTGKRYYAHDKGDSEIEAPAVLYWFETKRDGKGGAEFVPHLIDGGSGIGTQVTACDLNSDGTPDIIVSNKKGTFVFLSR